MTSKSEINKWAAWKTILVAVPTYGGFALLISLFPQFSMGAAIFGIVIGVLGTVGLLLGTNRESLATQLIYVGTFTSILLALGTRGWIALVGMPWLWISLHTSLFLLILVLPRIAPRASSIAIQEQTEPQTWLGQGCLSISLILLPAAAGLGSIIGLYGPRYGLDNIVFLLVALLGSSVGAGLGHWFSHHLWEEYQSS